MKPHMTANKAKQIATAAHRKINAKIPVPQTNSPLLLRSLAHAENSQYWYVQKRTGIKESPPRSQDQARKELKIAVRFIIV